MSTTTLHGLVEDETVQTGTPDAKKELPPNWEARTQRMLTKEDQIAEYGVERWNRDFVRLSSIETLPGISLEGEALQNEHWRKLPNSKFKRFQEAVCSLPDFIVPRPLVVAGEIFYPRSLYPMLRSVKGCLVDVDAVPNALLKHMTLFNAENIQAKDDLTLIEAKYNSLPAFKKAYEATVQIAPKNLRVLVLQKPWDSINKMYPGVPDIDEEVIGSILYSREYPRGKYDPQQEKRVGRIPQRQVISFFPDVYRALSKTRKQKRNYDRKETPMLSALVNDLKTLNEHFRSWVAGCSEDLKEDLIQEAEEVIARTEEQLKNCTQRYKVRIYEMVTSMRVTLEAHRSGPAMSKMIGALNAVEDRREDIDPKGGYNSRDAHALRTVITEKQNLLHRVRGNVENGVKRLGFNLASYKEETPPTVVESTIERVMQDLRLPMHANELPIRPFRTYVEVLNAQADAAQLQLQGKNKKGAVLRGLYMHVFGKFQAAHTCVEYLKNATSDPKRVSMPYVRKLIARIIKIFEGREVFPDEAPIHVVEVYQPVDAALHNLNELVNEVGPNIETDDNAMLKFCDEIQKQLDAFDMERLTRDLAAKIALEQNE